MPSPPNLTNITPPRVPIVDERTGLISREWYRFFLNLFNLTGEGSNTTSLTDLQLGPIEDSANEQIAELAKQVEGLEATPIPALGTFAALQQANLPWTTFDTTPESVPSVTTGTLYWDNEDRAKTLALVMEDTGDIIQEIGEDTFYRVKATATITKGQVLMFTGTVGASGGLLAAPATGLTAFQSEYILGIATQDIALNGWGYATWFGEVSKVNTTGGVEAWVDGQILYYNPAVAGGLTKNVPTAPNPKVIVASVVHAATNGILFVRPTFGSALGATDSNVEITSLTNGDILQYDSGQARWENVPASTLPVGTATNLAGGATGSVPYQSAASTTAMLPIGTALQVLKVNAGATAPQWVSGAALTKVDDTNVTLTLGGTPATSLLAATSLTLGWAGQLAVSRGGTGVATATANTVFAGPTTGAATAPSFRSLVSADIPALSYVTSVGATAPITSTGGLTPTIGVTAAALTKTDDTNVTLTLGGSPTTALLAATSLALGWTGQLSAARGGTGTGVYVVGDILYADTTSTLAKLADVATGNALISGGVGVAPNYGKIGLTTHVSGVLPTANGGTNLSSFTANGIVYASSSNALATGSALSFDGTNFSTTGSATATAFIPSGSSLPTNGLYLPAANTIALSANTTEILRATSNGEILVNGTTAISSSAGTVSIQRTNNDPSLRFFRNDTTISSGNSFGTLSWYGNDTTSNLPVIHAYIEAQASATHAAGDNPTDIVFGTTPDNTAVVAEAMRITQAKNLKIGGTASRGTTEGTNQLVLFNGTAPVGTLTNGVSFYSAAGEARVMDAAGNSTLLSPHDQATNEWIFHSKHTPTGKVLRIDVEKMLRFINDHFGLDMVHEFTEDA